MITFNISTADAAAIKAAIAVASAHFGWPDRLVTDADVRAFVHQMMLDALETDLQTIYEASAPFCSAQDRSVFCPRALGRGYTHRH